MTAVTQRYLLPADVDILPLPDTDEVLVSRRGSRLTPQLLSGDAHRLLQQFAEPVTLVQAVLDYSRTTGDEPLTTLDDAFAVLVALTHAELLVAAGTDAAAVLEDRRRIGERVGPATIISRIRVLRDGEIWRAQLADHTPVVVKIVDQPESGPDLLAREIAALRCLDGVGAPQLLWVDLSSTGGSLVMTEVAGDPADLVALVAADDTSRRTLALAVLDRYVTLHERGILHGDTHPGNVLVGPAGEVTLIDFGLARVPGLVIPPPRASGGEYLDPQAAAALLVEPTLPRLRPAAEQYAIAALVFRLLTGAAYLDLDVDRHEALKRILSEPPRPFVTVGTARWSAGERVLRQALAKDPADRFSSLRAFREAFAAAVNLALPPAPAACWFVDARPAFDVTGPVWASATAAEAAPIAALLQQVAALSDDVTAHDLAVLWRCRSTADALPEIAADHPAADADRALTAYAQTGRDSELVAAVRAVQVWLGRAS